MFRQVVFEIWKEDNEACNGQGHRRNMLSSDFCSVGIGHAYYDGYDYWVTELMTTVSGKDIKISLTVTPKNVSIKAADAVKRGFVVQWTKDPLVSGYEIRYSLRKDMKSSKSIMLTSYKTTKKKITNLNKKKKYYIQVRSDRKSVV